MAPAVGRAVVIAIADRQRVDAVGQIAMLLRSRPARVLVALMAVSVISRGGMTSTSDAQPLTKTKQTIAQTPTADLSGWQRPGIRGSMPEIVAELLVRHSVILACQSAGESLHCRES